MNVIFGQKLWFVMLEQFFMKYIWSGTGMIMVALPILTGRTKPGQDKDGDISERSQYMTTSKNLLTSAADAIERLMSSYKVHDKFQSDDLSVYVFFLFNRIFISYRKL